MTIKVPKPLRGFHFPEVTPLTWDRFDVELILPMLFFRVITHNRERAHAPRRALCLGEIINELQHHPHVFGFGDEPDLLERVVRTAMVQMGRKGKNKYGPEQITGITVPSLLAFKAGFPTQTSLLANVDQFLYQILEGQFSDWSTLLNFFKKTFGKEVNVWDNGNPGGIFEPKESDRELDPLTRLGLAFLDQFQSVGVKTLSTYQQNPGWDSLPAVTEKLGQDLVRFLSTYRDLMPSEALMEQTRGLVNFELFIYTLKLVYAIDELVKDPSRMPNAMVSGAKLDVKPEIYLDFAGVAEPLSQQMANGCVRRDLDEFQAFISAKLELRELNKYARLLRNDKNIGPRAKAAVEEHDAPRKLQLLLNLRDDTESGSEIEAQARATINEIENHNSTDADVENEELQRLLQSEYSALSGVVTLLVQDQIKLNIYPNVLKWFSGIVGATKPYGIVQGGERKTTWRYAPTNALLSIFVQLAQVSDDSQIGAAPRPIKLSDFIDYLRGRFGILVNRPPEGFTGPEYTAAAQANLDAMLDRLREMGVFLDLSDDFTVQRLTPMYQARSPEGVS